MVKRPYKVIGSKYFKNVARLYDPAGFHIGTFIDGKGLFGNLRKRGGN